MNRQKMNRPALRIVFSTLVLATGLALSVTDVAAESRWRVLRPAVDQGRICLEVEGRAVEYFVLDDREPTILEVRGPRRVKLITRLLDHPGHDEEADYGVNLLLDGAPLLTRRHRAGVKSELHPCDDDATPVGVLRRITVAVGAGSHRFEIYGLDGRVAARFYRESRLASTETVPYSPEVFGALRTLHFESGAQSTYYTFGDGSSLAFDVRGPTTLRIHTRLDFDSAMNGTQNYCLEVLRDGESWQQFHYHARKLSSAVYLEREDILPGARKTLRLPVPPGRHRFELRCLRPQACGVAAQIRIPARDIDRK